METAEQKVQAVVETATVAKADAADVRSRVESGEYGIDEARADLVDICRHEEFAAKKRARLRPFLEHHKMKVIASDDVVGNLTVAAGSPIFDKEKVLAALNYDMPTYVAVSAVRAEALQQKISLEVYNGCFTRGKDKTSMTVKRRPGKAKV